VKRYRIMDTSADACVLEMNHQSLAFFGADYVEMVDGARPRRFERNGDGTVGRAEQAVVFGCTFAPCAVPLL
jgi:hypothetical protein